MEVDTVSALGFLHRGTITHVRCDAFAQNFLLAQSLYVSALGFLYRGTITHVRCDAFAQNFLLAQSLYPTPLYAPSPFGSNKLIQGKKNGNLSKPSKPVAVLTRQNKSIELWTPERKKFSLMNSYTYLTMTHHHY